MSTDFDVENVNKLGEFVSDVNCITDEEGKRSATTGARIYSGRALTGDGVGDPGGRPRFRYGLYHDVLGCTCCGLVL